MFSEQSPLGSTIIGLKEGAKTAFTTPNGKEVDVEILLVETWAGN